MHALLQDLRFALRGFRKSPGFTATAVLSLALGIGVNATIFGLINAVLLRPLPVARPEQLVSIYHRSTSRGFLSSSSYPDYEYYRDHNTVFSGLMAFLRTPMGLSTGEQTQKVSGELVTPNYFDVLGIPAAVGRTFAADDARRASAVAVIGDRLWRQRFAGDPRAIGQTIHIAGHPFTVIGVAPRAFRGVVLDWGDPPELWLPLAAYREAVPALGMHVDPLREWGMQSFLVTGRLKPDKSLAHARAEMETLASQVGGAHPERERLWGSEVWKAEVYPAQQARFWPEYRKSIFSFLGLLWALVGAVLLIACSNVANLMLTRALKREREMAIRVALGAGRLRLMRQLFTESLMLAMGGASGGLIFSVWVSGLLLRFERPFRIPLSLDLSPDARVLGFTALISLGTAVVFGLLPIREAWSLELTPALKSQSTGQRPGGRRFNLRNILVIAQIALSLLLLVAAGLFVRTLRNARSSDVMFRSGNIVLAQLDLYTIGYSESRGLAFYRQLLERAGSLPGVQAATLVDMLPLGGMRGATDIQIGRQTFQINMNVVAPRYFEAIGIPLVAGRDFTPDDDAGMPLVAVINEQMARRFWPAQDPIGKHFELGDGKPVEVAGVVRDGHMRSFRDPLSPCFYLTAFQDYRGEVTLVLRITGDPLGRVPALRRELRALDPSVPLSLVRTMDTYLNTALSQERMASSLLSVFGILALALAAIGIYGVMSFSVSQRTREIGIRFALGAQRREVLLMVLRESVMLSFAGIALGWMAGWGLAHFAGSMLYGIGATDLPTFAAVSMLLFIIMLAANVIPAARAMQVDPMVALREE